MERSVASGSLAPHARRNQLQPVWTTHAASTSLLNCFARVLATSLRKVVPVSMPLTPPSFSPPRANSSAAQNNNSRVSWSSKHTFNISFVHPPGPDDEPADALRKHVEKIWKSPASHERSRRTPPEDVVVGAPSTSPRSLGASGNQFPPCSRDLALLDSLLGCQTSPSLLAPGSDVSCTGLRKWSCWLMLSPPAPGHAACPVNSVQQHPGHRCEELPSTFFRQLIAFNSCTVWLLRGWPVTVAQPSSEEARATFQHWDAFCE